MFVFRYFFVWFTLYESAQLKPDFDELTLGDREGLKFNCGKKRKKEGRRKRRRRRRRKWDKSVVVVVVCLLYTSPSPRD